MLDRNKFVYILAAGSMLEKSNAAVFYSKIAHLGAPFNVASASCVPYLVVVPDPLKAKLLILREMKLHFISGSVIHAESAF